MAKVKKDFNFYKYLLIAYNSSFILLCFLLGKFRMILKIILRYNSNKDPLSRLFHLASVEYKDDIRVLKETVLDHIGASLKLMVDGGRFIVDFSSQSQQLLLLFSSWDVTENNERLCDVPIRFFVTGDLKFYAQMLGRDNMSGCWCMWCLKAPNEWKKQDDEIPPSYAEEWTITKLKSHKLKVAQGMLKTPTEIRGVVDFPLWDFIEVINYVYPVLHGEIGLINLALDSFYDILDDNVEVMSEEEKIIRNTTILTDAAFETSRETLEELKASTTDDVSFQEIVLEEILASLRQRGISEEEKNRLRGEMEEVKANIRNMKMEVKNKANDVKQKKLAFTAAKKNSKNLE